MPKKESKAWEAYLIELVVVFVGVALAFAVENLREDLNERDVGREYLSGFREDLTEDAEMLSQQLEIRRSQLVSAATALEFFDGRAVDPQAFFEAYYAVLPSETVAPSRNTMDEVLNSGNLRLIRDADIRTALLDLYTTYDRIARLQEHMARDFDAYLYDPTFSSIPATLEGPWPDTPANRQAMEILLGNLTIENGIRLFVGNVIHPSWGLRRELELALSQVETLLRLIPAE